MQSEDRPKQHKTLSDKLRKKREQLKKHKKQKKIKHQAYDAVQAKRQFFEKRGNKKQKDNEGIKVYKLKKYLKKFTKYFEDDLQDFYQIWRNLDEGAEIDLEGIQNQNISKVLKSICKCLGLRKVSGGYIKPIELKLKLGTYIKVKMEEVIDNYLQNGSQEDQELSQEQQTTNKKLEKDHKTNHPKPKSNLPSHSEQPFQIPKEKLQTVGPAIPKGLVGPILPPALQKIGQNILNEALDNSNFHAKTNQIDEIDRIFGQIPSKPKQSTQPTISNDLYATGSAKLHQQQQPNGISASDYIQQYNKEHRPKSLMQIHRQKMKQEQNNPSARKPGERLPFSRQQLYSSDKVDLGKLRNIMDEGGFFNFEQKMSKPSINKNFL